MRRSKDAMSIPPAPVGDPRALLESPAFRRLVSIRWTMSLALTAALFVLYYGYILLIAVNRPLLSRRDRRRRRRSASRSAPAVIVGAWMLTAIYVVWANRHYDAEAARLRRLHRNARG